MPVHDGKPPIDVGTKDLGDLEKYLPSIGLVCAYGQPFFRGKRSFVPKKAGDYCKGNTRYQGVATAGLAVKSLRDNPAVWPVGTAFTVDSRTMLTAWHVVEAAAEEIDCSVDDCIKARKLYVVLNFYNGPSKRHPASFCVERAEQLDRRNGNGCADVGRLVMDADFRKLGPTPLPFGRPSRNDVEIIGHPLGQKLCHAAGTITAAVAGAAKYGVALSALAGNSGSPVFCNSAVVGIYTGLQGANGHDLELDNHGEYALRAAAADNVGEVWRIADLDL